jgi:hypothetical protein
MPIFQAFHGCKKNLKKIFLFCNLSALSNVLLLKGPFREKKLRRHPNETDSRRSLPQIRGQRLCGGIQYMPRQD